MSDEPAACLYCREPLRPGATRCPACSSWQTRWGADSKDLRLELAVVGVAFLLLAGLGLAWLAAPRPAPPTRTDHAATLTVDGAEIVSRRVDDHQTLAVRATAHSRASVDLRDLSVLVRLRDAGGRVLEEFSGRDSQVVVPAGGSAPLLVATSWSTADPAAVTAIEVEVRRAERAD